MGVAKKKKPETEKVLVGTRLLTGKDPNMIAEAQLATNILQYSRVTSLFISHHKYITIIHYKERKKRNKPLF